VAFGGEKVPILENKALLLYSNRSDFASE